MAPFFLIKIFKKVFQGKELKSFQNKHVLYRNIKQKEVNKNVTRMD